MEKSKPIAVITGDVHFTPATLDLATACVLAAKEKALELGVPLILNGDTLDSKAVVRAECANRLIEIFKDFRTTVYINIGNHDLLSEKSEAHALNFLDPYAEVIDQPTFVESIGSWIIPYHHDSQKLQEVLDDIQPGSRLIIHQGVKTAYLGHYVMDKSSLPKDSYSEFRVIASHYHRAQNIKCGRPRKGALGLFSYIGNPYSLSFGEAQDGPKGFQILYDNGFLELIPTNLRRHVILERTPETADEPDFDLKPNDLLWLKVTGPRSELSKLDKKAIGNALLGHSNYKLDLIATDTAPSDAPKASQTGEELLDRLIDQTGEPSRTKGYLKLLWRELVNEVK